MRKAVRKLKANRRFLKKMSLDIKDALCDDAEVQFIGDVAGFMHRAVTKDLRSIR